MANHLLPPQTAYYTNWFHVDSLCDYHRVSPYSPQFYEFFDSYMENAASHGMNTLLLPAFTPPLDTPCGFTRRNVQLVDVVQTDHGFEFRFEKMKCYIEHARSKGIQYFEHTHLFSQWGAKSAVFVYNTSGQLIFGWDTPAQSPEYRSFLRSYLQAFFAFADREGIEKKRLLFHISDEPSQKNLESYRAAYNCIADLLEECIIIDALSDFTFYQEGLVKVPVVHIPQAEVFYKNCPDFWLYYTAGPGARNCSNRLITNSSARTRVLGLQLYYYRASGFLHWGYNFYYDRLSEGMYDPKSNPCGYKMMPGCSYIAYPTVNGAAPSIREKLMLEAFLDLRLLSLAEEYFGREAVLTLCKDILGEDINVTLIPDKNALFQLHEILVCKIGSVTV